MEYLQIFVLAVLQGLAELLPVSSSAHVILAQKLMGLDPSGGKQVFLLVMLHTGTMFAVLFYFWRRWLAILYPDVRRTDLSGSRYHFVYMVVLASIVTAAVGYALVFGLEKFVLPKMLGQDKVEIEDLFKNLPLMGCCLLAVSAVILIASWFEEGAVKPFVSARSAILIGLVQAVCLPFRGFSRSGATISTGFLCGVKRSLCEDFSFALAVVITPAVIVRGFYKLFKDDRLAGTPISTLVAPGLMGMLFSFLAGLVALRFLSAVLEKGGWKYFGIYCIAAAAVVFAAAYAGY